MKAETKSSFMNSDGIKTYNGDRCCFDHKTTSFCLLFDVKTGTTIIGFLQLLIPPLNIVRCILIEGLKRFVLILLIIVPALNFLVFVWMTKKDSELRRLRFY